MITSSNVNLWETLYPLPFCRRLSNNFLSSSTPQEAVHQTSFIATTFASPARFYATAGLSATTGQTKPIVQVDYASFFILRSSIMEKGNSFNF